MIVPEASSVAFESEGSGGEAATGCIGLGLLLGDAMDKKYTDVRFHYVGGEWKEPTSGQRQAVLDPATNNSIGTLSYASEKDLDEALRAAETGHAIWRRVSAYDRSKVMRKAADLLRARMEQIAVVLTLEQGKVIAEARGELLNAADIIDWFAEEGRRAYGRIIPARGENVRSFVVMEGVGPVAGFSPWNFPVVQAARKVCAALAAGCSIIIKCPEETPGSPIEFVRCFHDAGVPAGVINLVYGVPAQISEQLIGSPVIRKISFTGSIPVGKNLSARAGYHMKRATMELGGHAPVLIFDDAEIDHAATVLCALKCRNAGQVCISPTRFFVQRSVYDKFVAKFLDLMKSVKVGNGLDESSKMGPMANPRRVNAMEALVLDAQKRGAELALGGKRIGNEGNFFEPTIIANAPDDSRVMTEEPFGPIAVIASFNEMEEAITKANRLPFGLAAYAFTQNARTALQVSNSLDVGMVSINHFGLALPETPIGGVKDSGFGYESGPEGLAAYMQAKFVSHMA